MFKTWLKALKKRVLVNKNVNIIFFMVISPNPEFMDYLKVTCLEVPLRTQTVSSLLTPDLFLNTEKGDFVEFRI